MASDKSRLVLYLDNDIQTRLKDSAKVDRRTVSAQITLILEKHFSSSDQDKEDQPTDAVLSDS